MACGPVRPVRRFFGREAQLGVVAAHLEDLDRSLGGLLLFAGEAGMGKSRLAEEVVALARASGARTAWGAAWSGDGVPALWPWVQVLRQLGLPPDELAQTSPTTPAESEAARFEQLASIAEHLRCITEAGSLVVVVDDLHRAGTASIRVLAFVARALRDVGCLFVGTYRPSEFSGDELAMLATVGATVALPPLSREAATELLHAAAGEQVSADAVDTIVARSGGNPLFVWEFGQLLVQSGRLDVAPAAVPDAVAAVIDRRLARLSERAVALLRAAAIAGNWFSEALVAAIAETSVEEAAGGLHDAVAIGLVVESPDAAALAFSHDVVREVVLEGIEPGRRAHLHRCTARVLEDRVASDPSLHAVIAGHLSRAGPAYAATASLHWERAARRALGVLDYEEAANAFARAARHCIDEPLRYAELLVELGEALLRVGDLEAARARFGEALAAATASSAVELAARAVLGIGAGPVAWEVPLASQEHSELVAHTLSLLPESAIELRSMLLARLSITAADSASTDLNRRRAHDALELAEQVGDPVLIGQALGAINDAYAGPDHTLARRANADMIVELAMTAGDRSLELLGYRFRLVADLEVGDIAAVDQDIAAFSRLAAQLRQPLVSWYVPVFHGMRALLDGDLDVADRYQAEVAQAAETTGSHNARMLAFGLLFGIDVARGRHPDEDAFDRLGDFDPADWAVWAAGRAMVKLVAGEPAAARDLLKLHADGKFSRLGDDAERLITLSMFARVAVTLDEPAAAAQLYDLLRPHSGLWVVDGIASCCWGPVDLELARLALALNRLPEGRDHLEQARRDIERLGAPVLVAEVDRLEAQVRRSVPLPATDDRPAETGENLFRRDGQFWTLAYSRQTVRVKDAKGLHDLARLLVQPGHEVHVLELAVRASSDSVMPGHLGELLDARARGEYRRRLAELEDELADAEACADLGRAERARSERDFIAAELSAALGLAGRPRRVGDPAERARKAVSGRIRLTIGRIEQEHHALARHLANSVRTGTYCVYEPETPMIWIV